MLPGIDAVWCALLPNGYINTDDQGVFSTSLEREYSLMALALERNEIEGHKNSPRAILEWLNRVREMSIEQRFDRGL